MQMYKDVWNRIQEFENAGLNVLYTNHTHNLERVRTENFAYMADETSAATLMSKDCEVSIDHFLTLTTLHNHILLIIIIAYREYRQKLMAHVISSKTMPKQCEILSIGHSVVHTSRCICMCSLHPL